MLVNAKVNFFVRFYIILRDEEQKGVRSLISVYEFSVAAHIYENCPSYYTPTVPIT
jgi:hypothetical protein